MNGVCVFSGMGQPFQNLQQQQQQPGGQQQLPGAQVQQQPSVSLLGTGTSGGGSLMSGSLIPSSAVGGRGTLPRTVPLTAVSQQQWPQNTQQQQWPNMQTVSASYSLLFFNSIISIGKDIWHDLIFFQLNEKESKPGVETKTCSLNCQTLCLLS